MLREQLVALVVGTVLPILVGLVTKASVPERYKSLLLAALSAASGFGTAFLNTPHGFSPTNAALGAFAAFLSAVGLHLGLYQPTGVADKIASMGVKDPTPSPTPVVATTAASVTPPSKP
jgi:small basic protein